MSGRFLKDRKIGSDRRDFWGLRSDRESERSIENFFLWRSEWKSGENFWRRIDWKIDRSYSYYLGSEDRLKDRQLSGSGGSEDWIGPKIWPIPTPDQPHIFSGNVYNKKQFYLCHNSFLPSDSYFYYIISSYHLFLCVRHYISTIAKGVYMYSTKLTTRLYSKILLLESLLLTPHSILITGLFY